MLWLTYLFEWMRCFSLPLTQEITRLLSSEWSYTQAYVNASSHSGDCQARRTLALCLKERRVYVCVGGGGCIQGCLDFMA